MGEIVKTSRVEVLKANAIEDSLKELLQKASDMTHTAYAPHSHFRVGAAGKLRSGAVVTGNNQENDAYPSGMCAERVLVYYSGAHYPNDVLEHLAIAVHPDKASTDSFTPPCGACLQALIQLEKRQKSKIIVYIKSGDLVFKAEGIDTFLPFSFDL